VRSLGGAMDDMMMAMEANGTGQWPGSSAALLTARIYRHHPALLADSGTSSSTWNGGTVEHWNTGTLEHWNSSMEFGKKKYLRARGRTFTVQLRAGTLLRFLLPRRDAEL
jgi:hypothetical protein